MFYPINPWFLWDTYVAYKHLNLPVTVLNNRTPAYIEIVHPNQGVIKMSTLLKYVGLPLLAISGAYYVYYERTKRCAKKLKTFSDGITDSSVACVKFTWTIKNISFRKTVNETLSDVFSDRYNLWQLKLINKDNFGHNDCFSIILILVKSNLPETYAKFQCSAIIDPIHPYFRSHDVCKFKKSNGFYRILNFCSLSLLKNDTLVISWEVHSLINDHNARPLEDLPGDDFRNLARLFSEEKFCDFTFVIGQEEFHVHKIILGSVSEVFEAMFESEMQEQIEGRVELQDIHSETFKEMLRFIYTGEADFEHHAEGLLIVADKYDIGMLKLRAEEHLIVDLSVENAAATLELADRYSAPALKDETTMFIEANKVEVVQTPGWEQLKTTYPQVIADLYSFHS